ncbi:hypothetical protein K0M31_014568 [Melipona bicolor]|uniref:Uncharacterized protein n=1 Tax=Melipona bicolor TaxID=60889 RepID=A0AA40KUH2_9HYME|nr:hypothetical protein K0M31_014568 [Melipona bicolor]
MKLRVRNILADPSNRGHLVDVINHSVATITPTDCHNYTYAASRGRRNNASNVTAEDDAIGRDSRERTGTKRAEGEDYEGEDEYEDELKAVAESHEAMSRDDTRNSNASTAASAGLAGEASSVAKNFDSREVITVNSSDEDVASNEAITDEIVDKYDQEVAELLKYKKERNSSQSEGSRAKTKRVPTVKKELSTQKEILIGSNETQVPKSLVPPEDPANRLNEETDAIQRRNVESNRSIESEGPEYSERSRGEGEIVGHNRYSESEANGPKKLDKRQETILQDLKSYLLTEYATEEEQRQKLRELGDYSNLNKHSQTARCTAPLYHLVLQPRSVYYSPPRDSAVNKIINYRCVVCLGSGGRAGGELAETFGEAG